MFKKMLFVLLFAPVFAFAAEFVAGKDYQILSGKTAKTPEITQVTEFFSYGCPWCYRIEKPLQAWLHANEKKVHFDRIPVVFKQNWDTYAKAYYTMQSLSLEASLNSVLFQAVQSEKTPLDTSESMIDFFVKHGVDKDIAHSAFESSPVIDLSVSNGSKQMAAYQINAIPAFVINKRYKTDLQMAQNPQRLFEILNYLINKPAN